MFKYNLACQARVLLSWGCLNGNRGVCHETARSKTPPPPPLFEPCFQLQALGRQERSLREEKAASGRAEEALLQGREQADASSWGLRFLRPTSLLVYPLLLPTTSEPVCPCTHAAPKSAACRGFPHAELPVLPWGGCHRGGRLTPFAGTGMGAVPEHPPPSHILLYAQPAGSNPAMLTQKIIPRKTLP